MAHHSIYFSDLPDTDLITIRGEEAHHALRVKRLEAGDTLTLRNGRGLVITARLEASRKVRGEFELDARVVARVVAPPASPRLTVLTGVPKGDRIDQLVEGLSQVGAAAWGPLVCERSVVEPREGKRDRLERIALESLKQCNRAWAMEIAPPVPFAEAVTMPGAVLAHAEGGPLTLGAAAEVTLLIGPEGGFSDRELALANERGVAVATFGVHVMRIETAGVVAAALIMNNAQRRA